MKPIFLSSLLLLAQFSFSQEKPIQISGVYPAFAGFNSPSDKDHPSPECGIGALVPWAGRLWYNTYTSHALFDGTDKLYSIGADYRLKVHPESVGGTHACRMVHKESDQLIIGCYFIDSGGNIRVVNRKQMPGRLTAVARHISDPENKVLFLSQEGAIFEVDVHSLLPTLIDTKPTAGWHAKGAYTSQGVFVMSNNGEEPAPSPYWDVDYSDLYTTQEKIQKKYFKTSNPVGAESMGSLAEWDGNDYTLIKRNQYCEVTGPGGLLGAKDDQEQIWATGWDKRSCILSVRYRDKWSHYRFLKPSFTFEGMNGSYTEWPRIREYGQERYLAFFNGAMYDFNGDFSPENSSGFRPISSLLRTVTDWCKWDEQLVLASQETSVHGILNLVPGQPNSNLLFTSYDKLKENGPAIGWGGVWRDDYVKAGAKSDALHIAGHEYRTLHLFQKGVEKSTVSIEIDQNGNNEWRKYKDIVLSAGEYAHHILPKGLEGEWLRFSSDKDILATVHLHAYSNRQEKDGEIEVFEGIKPITSASHESTSIVRQGFPTRDLQFWHKNEQGEVQYFEVDENLNFKEVSNEKAVSELKQTHLIKPVIMEDEASIIVKRFDGMIFRLPKGLPEFSGRKNIRNVREVVQERFLGNLHGTFYEIPRMGIGKNQLRNQPDYQRMKPVATHNLGIEDFCTWRGLLVLSGIKPGSRPDGHIFKVEGSEQGLWFGEIDDLWKLGKPTGTGGPWKNTDVVAFNPSDPYLMTGYDKKSLTLHHDHSEPVAFIVEIDFLADGSFHLYKTIEVSAGETITYNFPNGFSAHWIRVLSDKNCKASAILKYE